jgi:hypothetical protein
VDLEQEVEDAAGLLAEGVDPREVLRAFAGAVAPPGGPERLTTVHTCSGCDEEAVCFRCKIQDVIGEQAVLAAPLILPKVLAFAQQAFAEALQARREAKATAAKAGPKTKRPPPPPGRQDF